MNCCKVLDKCKCKCTPKQGLSDVMPKPDKNERVEVRPMVCPDERCPLPCGCDDKAVQ